MPPSQAQNPSKIDSKTHSIANNTKVWFLHDIPSNLLTFACPEGMKIHQKSLYKQVKSSFKIYVQTGYKNISKNLLETFPKSSKMGWVEPVKSASDTNQALKELPRWFWRSTWPQNASKIPPQGLQNDAKMINDDQTWSSWYDSHDLIIRVWPSWYDHHDMISKGVNTKTFITRAPSRFRRS